MKEQRKEPTRQALRERQIEAISESEGNGILLLILFLTLEENQPPGK